MRSPARRRMRSRFSKPEPLNRQPLACSGAGAALGLAPVARLQRESPAPCGRREEPHVDFHRVRALLCAAPLVLLSNPATAIVAERELAEVKQELAVTQRKLADTLDTLAKVEQRLDQLESGGAPVAATAPSTPRIPPVNVDNPAISFVVDTGLTTNVHGTSWDFELKSGELFLSAPIDPFLRGYAAIVGSSEEGFDIEEAAVITTALPWNLTVKGGRFFADVGRLSHWHGEQLPFVDRPPSLERLIPGESGAEGAEVTWLAPMEHYFRVTTGLYNSIGERDELPPQYGSAGGRSFDQLTWLVRPTTYFDLTDTLNLEIGGTFFTVPRHGARYLYAVDATLRHQPGTSELYQGFVLGSEWLWNDERFHEVDDDGEIIPGSQRFRRDGGYAYLETFLGRQHSIGARFDYAQEPIEPTDRQRTYSAFATWFPSEFQRLRFQFDQIDRSRGQDDQRFSLQWTAFLGSHTHGFSNR
jgi:hypothetical protein